MRSGEFSRLANGSSPSRSRRPAWPCSARSSDRSHRSGPDSGTGERSSTASRTTSATCRTPSVRFGMLIVFVYCFLTQYLSNCSGHLCSRLCNQRNGRRTCRGWLALERRRSSTRRPQLGREFRSGKPGRRKRRPTMRPRSTKK